MSAARRTFLVGLFCLGLLGPVLPDGSLATAFAAEDDDDEEEEEEDEEDDDPTCRRINTNFKALGKQGGETTLSFDKGFQELWMAALETLSEGHYSMTGSSKDDGFLTGIRSFNSHDDTLTIVVTAGKPATVRMKLSRDAKRPFSFAMSYDWILCEVFKIYEGRLGATGRP